jgi:hypothetical protein
MACLGYQNLIFHLFPQHGTFELCFNLKLHNQFHTFTTSHAFVSLLSVGSHLVAAVASAVVAWLGLSWPGGCLARP